MNNLRNYKVTNNGRSVYTRATSKIDAIRIAWSALDGVGEMPAHLWGSIPEGWTSERVSASEVR